MPSPDIEEQADRLIRAVVDGATVYAEPGTAEVMGEFLPVQKCDWLEPGVLYAIDFGRYNLPKSLFDHSEFGSYHENTPRPPSSG